jgi:hypothetical protein
MHGMFKVISQVLSLDLETAFLLSVKVRRIYCSDFCNVLQIYGQWFIFDVMQLYHYTCHFHNVSYMIYIFFA